LDDRSIPYPNCISWNLSFVEEKLKMLKVEEENDSVNNKLNQEYGYRRMDDDVIWPNEDTGGRPTSKIDPMNFVPLWKNGGLRARSQEGNSIVASSFVVRMKGFTSPNMSLSCACRLVHDDGHMTKWKQTKYIRCTPTDSNNPNINLYYDFDDFVHFDENEVIDSNGYSVHIEIRGRSGLSSGVIGYLVLPARNIQTVPPTEYQQQYSVEVDNMNNPDDVLHCEALTLLIDLYLEPSMLSIKNLYSSSTSPNTSSAKSKITAPALPSSSSDLPTTGSVFDGNATEECVEFAVNSKERSSTTSSKFARVDTPTILFGRSDSETIMSEETIRELDNTQTVLSPSTNPSASIIKSNSLIPTPPSTNGALHHRRKMMITSPYTPRDPISEERVTIRELLKSITNATIPKYKGLVWKVGSTGGNKLRAYMSLRKLVLGKLLLLFYYLLFIIIITFFKLTYISFYMYSNN